MSDDFRPTYYDEDTDTELTYSPGFPYVMRDQGLYTAEDLVRCVLGDIADCAADAGLPCAAYALVTYEAATAEYDAAQGSDEAMAEWSERWSDDTWYPPDGIQVDWDGDAGTVTTTLTAGWPTIEEVN